MVNKKYKLYSSILALGLTLALMATGVWAILQQSVGVSTTVSFTATSVKGTINGEVEGGYAGIETDYETKALGSALTGGEIVQFGTKYVFANITGTNSLWNGKEAYYYVNDSTTEKVDAVKSTIASDTYYTVSNKSYVSNFSPTSPATEWTIEGMAFQPNSEGQTSAITLTLTIKNTGSSVIAVSFPSNQWSAAMSETTAPNDNLLVSYATSNNGSAFSEPVAFSTINSKSIVSGGITTIKLVVTVQDDSSSISPINLAFQVKLEKGVDVWDGTVASSFAGGSGTEGSPYKISNGDQLAYLATLPTGTYYELTNDIILNNATFTFKEDSGLVEVKNKDRTLYLGMSIEPASATTFSTETQQGEMGTVYTLVGNTYTAWTTVAGDTGLIAVGTDLYLGTSTAGNTSSSNTQFDTTASIKGQFYSLNEGVYTPSFLNVWNPIGTDVENYFGSKFFDGDGYEISGLYINTYLDNQGLFGYAVNSTIENVGVVDSYVSSISDKRGNIGCVAGYGENLNIDYCYNFGNISGIYEVGGVVGNNTGDTTNCYNTGTVSGGEDGCEIGGVIGCNDEGATNNCYNTGSVSGNEDIGGVVGNNNTGATNNCYNTGNISGIENDIGGVVGWNTGDTSNSYNIGKISGSGTIGGVVGYNNTRFGDNASMSYCYNTGSVNGTMYTIGGVTGWNYGGYIGNCYNTGSVNGMGDVGGVTGRNDEGGYIENCYNTGSVSGNDEIGGIIGILSSQSSITNCYNCGIVSGNDEIGGIIGFSGQGSITNCYNIGNISGTTTKVGGIVGWSSTSNISNCYYLSSSATTAIGSSDSETVTYTVTYCTDFDADQLLNSAVEISGSTYNSLITALNAWVANQTDPVTYRTWTLTGSTNGYPIFA